MSDILIIIGSIVVMFAVTIIFGCLCHITSDKSMSANAEDIAIILGIAWILACIIGGVLLFEYVTLDKRIEEMNSKARYEFQQESFIREGDYYDDLT